MPSPESDIYGRHSEIFKPLPLLMVVCSIHLAHWRVDGITWPCAWLLILITFFRFLVLFKFNSTMFMGTLHTRWDSTCRLRFMAQSFYPINCSLTCQWIRTSVEVMFKDVKQCITHVEFARKLQLRLDAPGKWYWVPSILCNFRACLYGNPTSTYFDCVPP